MIRRRTILGAGAAAVGLTLVQGGPVIAADRAPWNQLARRLAGDLVLPGDPGYPLAKQLELGQFDIISPRAVAYCVSAADVSVAVRFAQDNAVPVAVRSGGHSYGGYSTTPGLIIDTSRLNTVTVGDGVATIGPGAMNVDILDALSPHGLVVSEGGCPTVAVGGFLQGGGFGLLTRSLGMACDALVSAEVVLADGRIVTASARQNPELFWALRGGGGGNFGVVTSYRVTPHTGDQMVVANLSYPYDGTPALLDAVTHWLVDAPRTIGGGAYVTLDDAAPGAVPTVLVTLASRGTAAELDAEAARLIGMAGPPAGRQDGAFTYQALMMLVFGCAGLSTEQCHRTGKSPGGQLPRPAFGLERTRFCTGPITPSGWDEVMTAFDGDRMAGHARKLEVHFFGGAANDPGRTDTAYVHRDALFSVNSRDLIGDPAAATPDSTAVARRWVDRSFAAIDPYSTGETCQSWMDSALSDWRESYYAENYPRLVRVKRAYDPYRFFRFPQGIGVAD